MPGSPRIRFTGGISRAGRGMRCFLRSGAARRILYAFVPLTIAAPQAAIALRRDR